MKMKKILTCLLTCGLIFGIGACGNKQEEKSNSSQLSESPYSVKVNAIGSTTVLVSRTLTLRASVTGTTEKDVTWSSSNEEVASVSDKGVVTGLKAGTTVIKATLVLDSNAFGEISITVEDASNPTSISITGYDSDIGWVGETARLSAIVEPVNASLAVNWSTDNQEVASITNDGVLSFLSTGSVKVTVSAAGDPNVKAEKNFTVKKGVFDTSRSSQLWKFDHQGDEQSYIDMDDSDDSLSAGNNKAWFNVEAATSFYVETTFKIKRLTSNSWDWMGFGLGSGTTDTDSRFFMFSPHNPGMTANNFNKFIVMNGTLEFDGITTRSQKWGEMGINSIEIDDEVKIGLLRNGCDFYYLINGKVAYFDNTDKFCDGSGVDFKTTPYIVSYDIPVVAKDFKYTADSTEIDSLLKSKEFNKSFYAAYSNATYVDDSSFSLDVVTSLCKDHKLAALGDKTKLVKDFEIEFDVTNIGYSSEKSCFRGLIIAMSRYEASDTVEFVGFGRTPLQEENSPSVVRFGKWDYTSSMEISTAVSEYYESIGNIFPNLSDTYHIKITRNINNEEERAYFHIYVNDVEIKNYNVTNKKAKEVNYSTYLGSYICWIGGEYGKCDISNFKLKSNIQ